MKLISKFVHLNVESGVRCFLLFAKRCNLFQLLTLSNCDDTKVYEQLSDEKFACFNVWVKQFITKCWKFCRVRQLKSMMFHLLRITYNSCSSYIPRIFDELRDCQMHRFRFLYDWFQRQSPLTVSRKLLMSSESESSPSLE